MHAVEVQRWKMLLCCYALKKVKLGLGFMVGVASSYKVAQKLPPLNQEDANKTRLSGDAGFLLEKERDRNQAVVYDKGAGNQAALSHLLSLSL
jgi:hypothetical protein